MKNFIRVLKQNFMKEKDKKNANLWLDEETVKSTGMSLVLKLLKEVNDEVNKQPHLKENLEILAEKSISKIDVKNFVVESRTSCQRLRYEYEACLCSFQVWNVITNCLIDYTLYITESEFRQVAAQLSNYLLQCCEEEEKLFKAVAQNYINIREDGKAEIIFPAKIWGDKKLASEMIQNAENAGVIFVEYNSSPICQKAVLPDGWNISRNQTWDGFRFILDEKGKRRGEFRLKYRPSDMDNGEFDFFFEKTPMEVEEKSMKILLGKNDPILIEQLS